VLPPNSQRLFDVGFAVHAAVGRSHRELLSADAQDAFYFYRANWSSQPTLHLVGRRYVDRPYGVVDVKAYSNAARVRLRLNDEDQGWVPCEGGVCLWHAVRLQPGPNALLATADIAGTTRSDSIQWTYSGSPDEVRIKAGNMSGYVSKAGERYGSDTYFRGGNGRGINAPDTPMSERVTVAGEDAGLYDSFREGAFSYHVPVPSGRYRVTLHFEEPAADKAGVREFDVLANGVTALKDFDIYAAAGGKLKGVVRSFDAISHGDGVLIEFRPKIGNALVAALSIAPIDRH